MHTSYYHTLIGRVISFCFLLVGVNQRCGTVLESGGCGEWPWGHAAIGVVRRKLSEAERSAYANERARVVGYMRKILYSGLLLWLWWEARWDAKSGGGYGALELGSAWLMSGGIHSAPTATVAVWEAVDARWGEHVEAGEEVLSRKSHRIK